jgi:hypothetical protein
LLSGKNAENDFWNELDNYYNFKVDMTTRQHRLRIMNFSKRKPLGTLSSNNLNTFLQSEEAAGLRDAMKNLTPHYVEIFRNHFGLGFIHEKIMSSFAWEAFRDFGLGVLYDPRSPRPNVRHMHVMDSGIQNYAHWHRFNWIASIMEAKSPLATHGHPWEGWLYIDRLVGLSAEIFSISRPCQTKTDGKAPNDPPNGANITNIEIEDLTGIWSDLDFDEIEARMSQLEDHNPDQCKRLR